MSTNTTASPLRQRMIEDMTARNLGHHSQRSHIHSCRRFAAFLKRSPDTARMQSARSARLFCHLKLPKLLRCQSIPSRSFWWLLLRALNLWSSNGVGSNAFCRYRSLPREGATTLSGPARRASAASKRNARPFLARSDDDHQTRTPREFGSQKSIMRCQSLNKS